MVEGKKTLEDFEEGYVFPFEVAGLSSQEIKCFAKDYDPQRFHLDEKEAEKTHFGGLIASGFQTQVLCFLEFCNNVLVKSWAVGAPGIENLRWLRPWYPGEKLVGTVTLTEKRSSSKRRDRGYLAFRLDAAVNDQATISMEWTVIMLTKEGALEAFNA